MMQGLIVDWGGVLTMPIHTAIAGWLKAAGVDHDHYGEVVRRWVEPLPGEISPVHRLERGELAVEDFELLLSTALAREGSTVEARGLVGQMFADLAIYEDSMTSLVTRAHAAGVRTALLSNSWGNEYDRSDWHEMFDTVVISGEVGMRKPEPGIFELVLDRIGLPADECVFIDDMAHNIVAAEQAGLVGIVHRTFDETASELEALFPGAGWIHQRLH
jgi:haloacid dehalogenase superfamily, subfamily IA, variant 3 with third motif having DD or ED/haloacid dehalogenase superfamily, subfamily IA, variant 1 with third motif having Dx(3-4)D or Dx(3-4)E